MSNGLKVVPPAYSRESYKAYCDVLAGLDDRLADTIENYGYPDFWHRESGFDCLVRIILEQQVSLKSALAAYNIVQDLTGALIPENLLALSDDELKGCGFSRQKTTYTRALAEAVISGQLDVDALPLLPDGEIHRQLTVIKGIGEWTVNVYLMLALHRLDVFPAGDLALVKSMKQFGYLPKKHSKEQVVGVASRFKPYRSIFAMLLWHGYLARTGSSI